MLRLGNLYVKSYGDNEHGEAKKCLIDLFHVKIVVGLTLVKYGYIYSKRENFRAWGSNPPPFDL